MQAQIPAIWKNWKFEKASNEPSAKRRKIASEEVNSEMLEMFTEPFVNKIVESAFKKYPHNVELGALALKTDTRQDKKSLILKTLDVIYDQDTDSKELYERSVLSFFAEGVVEKAPGVYYKRIIEKCENPALKTKLQCWYLQWDFLSGKLRCPYILIF